eukprot:170133_1
MNVNKKRKMQNSSRSNQPPKKKQKTNKQHHKKTKQPSAWTSPQHCISWLLFNTDGVSIDTFFNDYFGTKPLVIRRKNPNYYRNQQLKFELNDVYPIIKQKELKFGRHMICKAYDGDKEEIAPWIKSNDKVSVTQFKKIIQKGYTVQFHHPQHFYPDIAKMIGLLESYFGVEVGCNVYITPNKKQGLAPHWDDVEVFVLQIEGTKRWQLYERPEDENNYPLQSSDSLDLSTDCPDAKLLMEFDLHPGDLLYFPRGAIHCARSVGKGHSTHLTISTHQRATWGDFLHTLMDKALSDAIDNNVELRKNMPLNFLSFMGSTFEGNSSEKQQMFMDKLSDIAKDVFVDSLPNVVHETCDVLGADFVSSRLPPPFMVNKGKKKKKKEIEVDETMNVCLKSIDWIRVVNDDEFDDENELNEGFGITMVDVKNNEDNVASFVDDSQDESEQDGQDITREGNEDMEEDGEFRLYSCLHNSVDTHCVEFADAPKNDEHSYIKLPMYLRPVVDVLIRSYPKKQTIKALYDACSEESIVTLQEIQELVKLLHEMQLVKVTK